MVQSCLYVDESTATLEYKIMEDHMHIRHVLEVMRPGLEEYADRYIKEIKSNHFYENGFGKIVDSYLNEQKGYNKFFCVDWDKINGDYKSFKKSLGTKCPIFAHTLSSHARFLNEYKAHFFRAQPERIFQVIKNIYDFACMYDLEIDDKDICNITVWEDNRLYELVERECYLPNVVGPGVESAILYHINPQKFPGAYKLGMFSFYFLSERKPIDMPTETSEFIMVKDAVNSVTGIIETDHNFFFPYQVFAFYALEHFRFLNDKIKTNFGIGFPVKYRYVLIGDFYDFIVEDKYPMLQTLMGNDDILKFEISDYY